MTDQPLDYEEIEQAFVRVRDTTRRLPVNTERRRAEEHLKLAEQYAYESRERPADRHAS